MSFRLTRDEIPSSLLGEDVRAGAFVSFVGRVRDLNEDKPVESLEYEAFDELAVSEGTRILEEVQTRFSIFSAASVHRIGHLSLGDAAIVVEVAAGHRKEAFEACEWIVDEVKARVPIWKKEYYRDGPSEWLQPISPARLTETDYYSRQVRLGEVGEAGQQRLRDARVLVIGAGGLGCAALPYLAAAGVGRIGICDFDIVEGSNLARQVLFRMEDVGKQKADIAKARLQDLNPFVQIVPIHRRFDRRSAPELIKDYDFILDCTDSLSTKFDVNEATVAASKRAIIAGIYRYEGQLQAIYPSGPCLACLWPEEPDQGCVGTCAEVGVLGSTPGVLGTLQASETIKAILGIASPLFRSKMILLDLTDLRLETVALPKRPECTICGMDKQPRDNPMELVPGHLSEYRVIDIREADERVEEPFPYEPSEWMPLSEWTGEGLDARPTLFVCRSGVRTMRVVKSLRDQGREETYSLPGGVTTLKTLQK